MCLLISIVFSKEDSSFFIQRIKRERLLRCEAHAILRIASNWVFNVIFNNTMVIVHVLYCTAILYCTARHARIIQHSVEVRDSAASGGKNNVDRARVRKKKKFSFTDEKCRVSTFRSLTLCAPQWSFVKVK